MERQHIYLPKYGWDITLFYNTSDKCDEVLEILSDLKCDKSQLDHAKELIGGENCGFTFSDLSSRETCVVVSRADSVCEFINSVTHEVFHVVQHIAKEYSIDMFGEEVCYLYGDIIMRIFNAYPEFTCKECYRKLRLGY